MHKNLKSFVFFLAVLIGLVISVQYGLDRMYARNSNQKFSYLMRHEIDEEIMFFGSSVIYHQIVPEVIHKYTGNSTYNMGWDAYFFVQYNSFIKEYLSYQKKCKFIVIGCDFENLGKNVFITRPDMLLAYINNEHVYRSLSNIEPEKIWKAKYIPGYKLTLMTKLFYKGIFFPDNGTRATNGYKSIDGKWKMDGIYDKFEGRFDSTIYNSLKVTLKEITAQGIKVIFIVTPIQKNGYKLIVNAEEIKSKYRALISDKVFFLDYTSDSLCANEEYFTNYSHLNGRGAAIFSQTVAHDINKLKATSK